MDIKDIAKRAKVSTATVSRVINNVSTVDPKLVKKVRKVIGEMGYYPNSQARALVSGRSNTFGLIVSEITNPFFPEIVQSFEDIAVEHNYEIMLTSTVHDPARMELALRRMVERRVDGVAIMTFGTEETLLTDNPIFREMPLVFVDAGTPIRRHVSNLRIDYLHGIRQAIEHLAELRHERIAFISGPPPVRSANARLEAYRQSMHEAGITVHEPLVVAGDHTIEGGMKAAARLLALPRRSRPTAVLCSNDMTALGVMHECFERGVNIPAELSVVGYDDIRLARYMLPPLTTVQMSQTLLAEMAFQALLRDVQNKDEAMMGSESLLETKLIVRQSTAPAPSKL
jgi:LacI family transcriptional regulator